MEPSLKESRNTTVMANGWLLVLLLASSFNVCEGKGECGHVPSTLVWPLGETVGTFETMTSVAGDATNTAIAPGPDNLNYQALQFAGAHSSVSLPVNIPGQLMLDYAFQFFMYPQTEGDVLLYQTDGILPTNDITTVKMTLTNISGIVITLESPTTTSYDKVAHNINFNQWYRVSVGRDGSRDAVFLVVDTTEYELIFPAWTDAKPTLAPGHVVLGAGFTGRLTCLQFIECRDPVGSLEYDTECNTWPALPNTTSTSPSTTSTTTTEQTTTTSTTPSPTTTSTTTTEQPTTTTTTSTTPSPTTTSTTTTEQPTTTTTTSTTPSPSTTSTTTTEQPTTTTTTTTTSTTPSPSTTSTTTTEPTTTPSASPTTSPASTTVDPTTTSTTTTTVPIPVLMSAIPPVQITEQCDAP